MRLVLLPDHAVLGVIEAEENDEIKTVGKYSIKHLKNICDVLDRYNPSPRGVKLTPLPPP